MSSVATETTPTESPGLAGLLASRPALAEPARIRGLRDDAAQIFEQRGVPTIREEAWRFTNVAAISRTVFTAASGALGETERALIAERSWPEAVTLVLVDGRLRRDLCEPLPEGIVALSIAEALAADDPRVVDHLGLHARIAEHPFAALSTALFEDGLALIVAAKAVIEQPIQVLHLSTAPGAVATASFPRLLIVAGEASQAKIVEHWVGTGSGRRLVCPVEEVVFGPAAVIEHARVQDESEGTFLIGLQALSVERGAQVASRTFTFGGGLVRNDVAGALIGEGVHCALDGLYITRGEQLVDNHMVVDHIAPHCDSHELFKGVLEGRSRAVFNGLLHVHPGAQKTDAKQTNRNLLLSPEALVNTNPQLEIYADDVKCTHGSTVGELDTEAVFYLRSRGIGEDAARSLLTWAFAREIVDHVGIPPLVAELEERLIRRLPRGEVVRQAAG